MKSIAVPLLLLVSLCASGAAFAGDMRCGDVVIQDGLLVGPTKYDVLTRCGPPTAREGNRWIYVRPHKHVKILAFNDNGQLTHITEEPPMPNQEPPST